MLITTPPPHSIKGQELTFLRNQCVSGTMMVLIQMRVRGCRRQEQLAQCTAEDRSFGHAFTSSTIFLSFSELRFLICKIKKIITRIPLDPCKNSVSQVIYV